MIRIKLYLGFALILTLSACDSLYEMTGNSGPVTPTQGEISSGLKQALDLGIKTAVADLNQEGGYFNDPALRIPFPPEAQQVERTLRDIGMGQLVDDFNQELNRGAEKAAAEALPIFTQAITSMTITDAMNILMGPEDAATKYFRGRTEEQLTQKFYGPINTSLNQVGAAQAWTEITTRYNMVPFVKKVENTDLAGYATDKALDGLFLKISEEEAKIRENPVERTTDLLRKVFGYYDRQKAASN